eukprot:TRINITY_DN4800_c0_g1_i1.p1 TRINITY_DN4800_c0_g1~~TRINITY_DN4800_c0_g1_i1.p1  ORF type:complete len:266 (-),score=108.90 TRINITY_DN4800_c0_g1_i1:95-892(-)
MDSEDENQFVDQLDLDSDDEGAEVVYKVKPPTKKAVSRKTKKNVVVKEEDEEDDDEIDEDEEEDRFFNGEFSDEDEDNSEEDGDDEDVDDDDDDNGAGVGIRQRRAAAKKAAVKKATPPKSKKQNNEETKKVSKKSEPKEKTTPSSNQSSGSSIVCWSIIGFLILVTLFFRFQMVTYDVDYESFMSNYGVLGLPEGASFQDVKKAHRQLSLKWHPDKNPGCEECKEKYIKIISAYETISEYERGKIHLVNKPQTSGAATTRGRKK